MKRQWNEKQNKNGDYPTSAIVRLHTSNNDGDDVNDENHVL